MTDNVQAGIILPSKAYDRMKGIVQIILPAISALYAGLAVLLNLPYSVQVVGVIALVTTFLGTILGISSKTYNNSDVKYDGVLNIAQVEDRTIHQIELTKDPGSIEKRSDFVLKVNPVSADQIASPPKS